MSGHSRWERRPSARPLLLDLFCGAGGAGYGYWLAGFDVVGVDHEPQPGYPFPFIQLDALQAMRVLNGGLAVHGRRLAGFAAIHASPPCQAFTVYRNNRAHVRDDHPNHIPGTRELLAASGLPYVIENVPGARAELRSPVQLCGTSFGIEVRRHRLFELGGFAVTPPPCDHGRFTARKYPGSSNRPNGRTVCNVGEYRVPLAMQREAMGISWMSLAEIAQAVPPAYTCFLGEALLSLAPADACVPHTIAGESRAGQALAASGMHDRASGERS